MTKELTNKIQNSEGSRTENTLNSQKFKKGYSLLNGIIETTTGVAGGLYSAYEAIQGNYERTVITAPIAGYLIGEGISYLQEYNTLRKE